MYRNWLVIFSLIAVISCKDQVVEKDYLYVYQDDTSNELALTYGNKLLTILHYGPELYKPYFFPVNTLDGIRITRGWPEDPSAFEPVDHPHQKGIWFNFGDINGIDFWNNSDSVKASEKSRYGRITCDSATVRELNDTSTVFILYNRWITETGTELLKEKAEFHLNVGPGYWAMERTTRMVASEDLQFNDNKEGLLAIRMAREFQSDLNKPVIILDSTLKISAEKRVKDAGKSGFYFASSGKTGSQVWGTANEWVGLKGVKDGDSITVVMMDHPQNFSHPPHWHARDYGLFSVNNFGRHSFIQSLEPLNLELKMGDELSLKHKIMVFSGMQPEKEDINMFYENWIE